MDRKYQRDMSAVLPHAPAEIPTAALPVDLAGFRDYHAGQTVIVCGCGASLNELVSPERFITIGTNDVGRLFTPDYLVVLNTRQQFKHDRFRHVESSRARAIFTQLELGIAHPNIVRIRLGRRGGTDFANSNVLHFTRNSPYLALHLAVHMGATRIGLIGVDFTDHHFFGQTGRHVLSVELPQIDREYKLLKDACDRRGVEIVNLSARSRLTAFPRMTPADFSRTPVQSADPDGALAGRKVFIVNYPFLSCGDVFRTGLVQAARDLQVEHAVTDWDDNALSDKVADFAPDLLFVVHGRKFAKRWRTRFNNVPSAIWLLDEPYEVDDTSGFSRLFRTAFVNDPGSLGRHTNAHYLPVCYDPSAHWSVAGGTRTHDVGFIGGYNAARESFLRNLATRNRLSYVVGGPWRTAEVKQRTLSGNIPPSETAKLYRDTRIVLNVFRTVHHYNRQGIPAASLNPRVYEATACGALVVSEWRPELDTLCPEMPTFRDEDECATVVEQLLTDHALYDQLRSACAQRLERETYAHRLAHALRVSLGIRPSSADVRKLRPLFSMPRTSVPVEDLPDVRRPDVAPASEVQLPDGWAATGRGVATDAAGVVTLTGKDAGFASTESHAAVRLSFQLHLDTRCHFIAKLHGQSASDPAANSYHLVAAPQRAYIARHNLVLGTVSLARNAWQQVEMTWSDGMLVVTIEGREVCRCADSTLPAGYCVIGAEKGSAMVRALELGVPNTETRAVTLDDWSMLDGHEITQIDDRIILAPSNGDVLSLVSTKPANDVELDFELLLDDDAHFIAKIHQQTPDDAASNSYHLVSTPAQGYVARHHQILGDVRLARRVWQHVRLRWVDQCLELLVNDRRRVRVSDTLLQSGYSVIGVSSGRAELRHLRTRPVAPDERAPHATNGTRVRRPGHEVLPFPGMPRRNLLYHIWPVRGNTWRWNVEQLLARIDLFNGRRIIGIVHDERSEEPDVVERAFDGHGCEFVVVPNGPAAEGKTFPEMLARVRSLEANDVSFYAHAKGVKYEPSLPEPVRRWTEAQYRVNLDDWPSVESQLERFAMTGAFKMLGTFRAHRHVGNWHYSGTYFWLRHAFLFDRDVPVQSFYGCVEAWPGVHFRRDETGCLFMDGLRQLPYHEQFWTSAGTPALARWEGQRRTMPPPASLVTPAPFEGFTTPRLEQHAEEFSWFLDALIAAAPESVLVIGSMHGGVEWHIARRMHALGRTIRITTVDIAARPELERTLADARRRFGQVMNVVIGDSAAEETRAGVGAQYDAVFIDGDHGYRGARADVDFALTRSPRLVALHDIVDSVWHAQERCCVSRVWEEVRARYPGEERIVGVWGGIGIFRPA